MGKKQDFGIIVSGKQIPDGALLCFKSSDGDYTDIHVRGEFKKLREEFIGKRVKITIEIVE